VALLALLASGCATRHQVTLEPNAVLEPPVAIEVAEPVDRSPEPEPGVPMLVSVTLSKELARRQLQWSSGAAGQHLLLRVQVLDYQRGNAFKRWLLPGWGSTVLWLRGDLADSERGTLIGSFESRHSVSFGGLYSVGAYQRIFERAAADVVDDIADELEKASRGETP
jgi:hypothetical protein